MCVNFRINTFLGRSDVMCTSSIQLFIDLKAKYRSLCNNNNVKKIALVCALVLSALKCLKEF